MIFIHLELAVWLAAGLAWCLFSWLIGESHRGDLGMSPGCIIPVLSGTVRFLEDVHGWLLGTINAIYLLKNSALVASDTIFPPHLPSHMVWEWWGCQGGYHCCVWILWGDTQTLVL